jgi:c-di-GMP-binding flagellar brake protein YcgR
MWAYSFYGVEFDKLPEEDKKKVIAYIAKSLLKQGENNE